MSRVSRGPGQSWNIIFYLWELGCLYPFWKADVIRCQCASKKHAVIIMKGIQYQLSNGKAQVTKIFYCSKKTQCCPTQVMLNEELQKFVLLLMGIIRRSVKHIGNQVSQKSYFTVSAVTTLGTLTNNMTFYFPMWQNNNNKLKRKRLSWQIFL